MISIQLKIPRTELNSCKNPTKLIQLLKFKRLNQLHHLQTQIQFTVQVMDVLDTKMMDLSVKNVHRHLLPLMATQSTIQFQI
jgi:hypothetical protein